MEVLHRRLSPVDTPAGRLWGLVRPEPGQERVLAFFASGTDAEVVARGVAAPEREDGATAGGDGGEDKGEAHRGKADRVEADRGGAASGLDPATGRQVGGGLILEGRVGAELERCRLPGWPDLELAVEAAEPELLAGRNVIAALVPADGPLRRAETLRMWLDYHARDHGMQAALLIDRAPPEGGGAASATGAETGAAPLAGILSEALGGAAIPGLELVVVLSPGAPLGAPDAGPEADRFHAPDAPGRDRMVPPAPDPWRAPFGEVVLFELLRWRFLSAARAVANLELGDLLAPHAGVSVFDRAADAAEGLVALEGVRAYPWAVRKGEVPGFGDHVCRRFDGGVGNPRWCVAPARLPGPTVWRLVRVAGATPDPGPPARYFRAMALRHPGAPVSAIVPKTSLVEDPVLVALATERFGARPVRPPAQALRPSAGAEGPDPGPVGIVTTMKNEGPFILEWLAYHRSIGVDHFLIYTNDCTDGTDRLLDLLQARGIVEHRDNPYRGTGLKPQHAALQAAESEPLLDRLDWIVCMDVDEFINIHVGEGRLTDLFAAVPGANMISMNWRLFGNADIHAFHDGFVTEQFVRCAPHYCRKPHQAWGFKTLYRNLGLFKKLGVHRPKGLHPQLVDRIRWVNGSGRPLPRGMFRNAWRSNTRTYGYDLVTLNHYAVRSAESFLVKRDRGRVNHVDRDQGTAYWFRMNNNAEEDRSIHRHLPRARAEFDRLLADPEIAAAHAACVEAHRTRIAELKARPDYAELYAELTSPRFEKLSRLHGHFGSGVFLAGPDVIPDEVVERDPDGDWFFTVEADEQVH